MNDLMNPRVYITKIRKMKTKKIKNGHKTDGGFPLRDKSFGEVVHKICKEYHDFK